MARIIARLKKAAKLETKHCPTTNGKKSTWSGEVGSYLIVGACVVTGAIVGAAVVMARWWCVVIVGMVAGIRCGRCEAPGPDVARRSIST